MEPGLERDVELHEGKDFFLHDGSSVDGSGWSGGVDAGVGSGVFRSGGGGMFRVVCCMVEGDMYELDGALLVAVVEMDVENFELVLGCAVRLVFWSSNGRGDFLCLMLVEANVFNVGVHLFGMVI